MKKSILTTNKCCATCIYWDGKVKYQPGFFGNKVEFDDSEDAKCNKNSGIFLSKICKGTDGSGFIFSCTYWKQRF